MSKRTYLSLGVIFALSGALFFPLFGGQNNAITAEVEVEGKDLTRLKGEWFVDVVEKKKEAFQLGKRGVPLLEELLFQQPMSVSYVSAETLIMWKARLAMEIARDGCPEAQKMLIPYYFPNTSIAEALPYLGDVEKIRWVVNKVRRVDSVKVKDVWPMSEILFDTNDICRVSVVPSGEVTLKKCVVGDLSLWFPTAYSAVNQGQLLIKEYVVTNTTVRYADGLLPVELRDINPQESNRMTNDPSAGSSSVIP